MHPRKRLIGRLLELARRRRDPQKEELGVLSDDFRAALLEFGSETDDNQEAASHLEYGSIVDGSRVTYGLRLKPSGVGLSQVAYALESVDRPEELEAQLSHEEWEAATRTIVLLLLMLDRTNDRA